MSLTRCLTWTIVAVLSVLPNLAYSMESPDLGGHIRAYVAAIAHLNRTGAAKVISGVCASACTMYLGVRNVCVEPDAELWFHAAHLPGEDRADPLGSLKMLSYYPRKVRGWAIQTGALEKTKWDGTKVLTGRQLIQMGIPRCRS